MVRRCVPGGVLPNGVGPYPCYWYLDLMVQPHLNLMRAHDVVYGIREPCEAYGETRLLHVPLAIMLKLFNN
jgi:hypothetical protein